MAPPNLLKKTLSNRGIEDSALKNDVVSNKKLQLYISKARVACLRNISLCPVLFHSFIAIYPIHFERAVHTPYY